MKFKQRTVTAVIFSLVPYYHLIFVLMISVMIMELYMFYVLCGHGLRMWTLCGVHILRSTSHTEQVYNMRCSLEQDTYSHLKDKKELK